MRMVLILEWTKAKYSINKGLWGTSVGGDETLTSKNSLPSEAYPSELSKKEKEKVVLSFSKGELVAVNYKKNTALLSVLKLLTVYVKNFALEGIFM